MSSDNVPNTCYSVVRNERHEPELVIEEPDVPIEEPEMASEEPAVAIEEPAVPIEEPELPIEEAELMEPEPAPEPATPPPAETPDELAMVRRVLLGDAAERSSERFEALEARLADLEERHMALESIVSTVVMKKLAQMESTMLPADGVPQMLRALANAMDSIPFSPKRTGDDHVHEFGPTTRDLREKKNKH